MFNSQIAVLNKSEIQLYLLLLFHSACFSGTGETLMGPIWWRDRNLTPRSCLIRTGGPPGSFCKSGLGKHWPAGSEMAKCSVVTGAGAVGGAGRSLLKSVQGFFPHTISQEGTLWSLGCCHRVSFLAFRVIVRQVIHLPHRALKCCGLLTASCKASLAPAETIKRSHPCPTSAPVPSRFCVLIINGKCKCKFQIYKKKILPRVNLTIKGRRLPCQWPFLKNI